MLFFQNLHNAVDGFLFGIGLIGREGSKHRFPKVFAVDTQGLSNAFAVTPANATDRNGALFAFEQNKEELEEEKSSLGDGGYSGKPFADDVKALLREKMNVQVVKRNELHTFKVISQ